MVSEELIVLLIVIFIAAVYRDYLRQLMLDKLEDEKLKLRSSRN